MNFRTTSIATALLSTVFTMTNPVFAGDHPPKGGHETSGETRNDNRNANSNRNENRNANQNRNENRNANANRNDNNNSNRNSNRNANRNNNNAQGGGGGQGGQGGAGGLGQGGAAAAEAAANSGGNTLTGGAQSLRNSTQIWDIDPASINTPELATQYITDLCQKNIQNVKGQNFYVYAHSKGMSVTEPVQDCVLTVQGHQTNLAQMGYDHEVIMTTLTHLFDRRSNVPGNREGASPIEHLTALIYVSRRDQNFGIALRATAEAYKLAKAEINGKRLVDPTDILLQMIDKLPQAPAAGQQTGPATPPPAWRGTTPALEEPK